MDDNVSLQTKVDQTVALEKELSEKIMALKAAQDQITAFWKEVEAGMIDSNTKSIKGDWGSVTIAERNNFKVDLDLLPTKFIKKVADTTKIGATYKLENKLPKGVELSVTKFLTKRIK
jgi:hypothetical protein